MKFLRNHWYDLGGFFALFLIIILLLNGQNMSFYRLLMCLSLISLFFHQLEEYRIVGTFPGMVNKIMFKSKQPESYPLNSQTAVYVNVFMAWPIYFMAIVFAERTIWLGMATILISIGNIIAHSLIFNIKGKTFYNAGMATSILLFLPISILFFYIIHTFHLVQPLDYLIGITLGIILNYAGIIKIIMWFKDVDSPYPFPKRCLLNKKKAQ